MDIVKIKKTRENLEKFIKFVDKTPPTNEIKINKYANNTKYLPISFVEMTLDEIFLGLWSTKNFNFQVVANEIVGTIDLEVYHPTAQKWITRSGCAAVQIQQSQGASITEIDKKIKNTLEKDFPHLKADCIKNAAKSIGKLFGRDLNRKDIDDYRPVHTPMSSLDIDEVPL